MLTTLIQKRGCGYSCAGKVPGEARTSFVPYTTIRMRQYTRCLGDAREHGVAASEPLEPRACNVCVCVCNVCVCVRVRARTRVYVGVLMSHPGERRQVYLPPRKHCHHPPPAHLDPAPQILGADTVLE